MRDWEGKNSDFEANCLSFIGVIVHVAVEYFHNTCLLLLCIWFTLLGEDWFLNVFVELIQLVVA